MPAEKILLGKIVAAHGIRGQVKIVSYAANPDDLTAYGPLTSQDGRKTYDITLTGGTKDTLLATIKGISDRNDAERLKGTLLYVDRNALPKAAEGEYYLHDLIGLAVVTPDGQPYGTVKGLFNFGAGDLLEIALAEQPGTELFAFTEATFPQIDVKSGKIIIHLPEIIEAPEEDQASDSH